MLMGEGAVAVVLQRTGLQRPGPAAPRVHARLRAVAMNCDAHHPTAPDPEGIGIVLADAYRRAGLGPEAIDLVMLHGSGTPHNDATEAQVLSRVFAGAAETGGGPLLTAIKSMTGHTLGGSGLLSVVMAALSTRHGIVPPILGLEEPIGEAAGLRLVHGGSAAAEVRTVQVDAFGFGGINAVAILEAA
jgi:3-oxoacyl-(acyl-carrier-protein) synthase